MKKGYVKTPEHMEKIKAALRGKPKSEAHKAALRKPKTEKAKLAAREAALRPEVQEKKRKTMLERYGVEFSKQDPSKNQNRVEYWVAKGWDEISARRHISSRQRQAGLCNQSGTSHWKLDFWMDRGFSEEAAKEKVSELQRANNSKSVVACSHVCTKFLDGVQKWLGVTILREVEVSCFTVDGYIPQLKVVIEFFGDFWHMNPNQYLPDYVHPVTGWKAESKWREDKGRIKKLVSEGFKVFCVWESDITPESIIKTAVEIYNACKKG